MNTEQIKKMIENFKKHEPPMSSLSFELEEIEDIIRQDFSDYIHFERLFLEGKLNDVNINEIRQYLKLSEGHISQLLEEYIPKTEEVKEQKEEIKNFNSLMRSIMLEMIK